MNGITEGRLASSVALLRTSLLLFASLDVHPDAQSFFSTP